MSTVEFTGLEVGHKYRFYFKKGGSVYGKYWGTRNIGSMYYYMLAVNGNLQKGFSAGYAKHSIKEIRTS